MLHWIPLEAPGRLATMARPPGGEELAHELRRLRDAGVTGLVSMLEPEEAALLELSREAESCAELGLSFRSHPVPDHELPSSVPAFWSAARDVHGDVVAGGAIAIHCFAGIGRSSLMAAGVLVLSGRSPSEVFEVISEARGFEVPDTRAQREWFERAVRSEGPAR